MVPSKVWVYSLVHLSLSFTFSSTYFQLHNRNSSHFKMPVLRQVLVGYWDPLAYSARTTRTLRFTMTSQNRTSRNN